MYEISIEIFNYLPNLYKNPQEKEYIDFLWDAFETNYEKEKYQFAFIAYHMMFMSFVYFSIWKIKTCRKEDFKKALIGFNKSFEKGLINASSPFVFSTVNESSVLRFFKLVNCGNDKIGTFTKLVKDRNEIAHSNGNIFYNDQYSIDGKIDEVLNCISQINENLRCIIKTIFRNFLKHNWNNDEREFIEDVDQIREILIQQNYFSEKDINYCLSLDINSLKGDLHFPKIKRLFKKFQKEYSEA
jgi:hypothetical protein